MNLTDQQRADFERDGYLFLPGQFDAEEVAALRADIPRIFAMTRQEVWREKDGTSVRTAFAAHTYSEPFGRLARHPRMVEPVRQLLGGELYVHQFKINGKAAFQGDVWQWHQDYGTWARDDAMPEPNAMNISVFLDDVTSVNGALMLIPRSHTDGVQEAKYDATTTSYPLYELDMARVKELADAGGIVAPTGKAGSMLMFHGNLVHASPPNISPWSRMIAYVTLNRCDNAIQQFKRPAWIAHRDFTPIQCLPDDCLKIGAAAPAE
jgi:ectoine hydroxylase